MPLTIESIHRIHRITGDPGNCCGSCHFRRGGAESDAAHPTVGFISLGCPKNLVDSEVMMGMLQQAGARLTTDAQQADVLVVKPARSLIRRSRSR